MARILVTGAAGYIGTHLVEALCACDWVDLVVGLDVQEPSFDHPRYRFVRRDVRESMTDLVSENRIQTIVHLAYVVAPIHNKQQMEEINLRGMANVLDACSGMPEAHLLHLSSASVYGMHPDNPVPLTEDSPLRPNEDFTYVKNKGEIEAMVQRFATDHPQIKTTVLRPCFVFGPGAAHPLATHVQKKVVFVPWSASPLQFVHVSDLTRIMLHFLAHRRGGVYNVAGEDEITFKEMLEMLGNIRIPVLWPVMYAMNQLAWLLRLSFITEVPSPTLRMLKYPWLTSTAKLRAEIGYEFAYDSKGAFKDFAEALAGPCS
jgi:UDP-glucose 4-epimerase